MVELSNSPIVYAKCGTAVILKCEVSSPKDGLLVKHMGWSLNGDLLCSIDDITPVHHKNRLPVFRCLYSHGNLTLVLEDVQPQDGGNSTYVCKLRSNMGVANKATTVEFKGQSAYLLLTLSWNKKTGGDKIFDNSLLGYFVWQRLYCLHNFLFSSPQNQTSVHGLAAQLLRQHSRMESDQWDP